MNGAALQRQLFIGASSRIVPYAQALDSTLRSHKLSRGRKGLEVDRYDAKGLRCHAP